MAWNPFGVSFELTASGGTVTRTSATQYTVKINATWETYYSGAQTNYGMTASSGGGSVTLNKFGTYASSGSGSFTGTYSISGNGSATKEITVTFKNFNNDNGDSATTTVKFNVSVPAWTSYTVSYNANGGTGAPSSQTKWKDQTLTLSSTKPTRTGYTFKGWALSKSDANNGTWYYKAGGTCGKNENLTLYATWAENKLTVNYYSNYATSAFSDALNTVGSDKNVIVWTGEIYYDNDYSTYGLANYSNSSGSVYMTRTGYTGTGKWGTSTSGGTLIDEDVGYSTGQAIAKALGKDLSNGNASINLYAQWSENTLTINYYSNYANHGTYQGETLDVSSDNNILVYTQSILYDNSYNNGLADIQNANYLYLSRTGYSPTGYWGTSEFGGILVNQLTSFSTGQAFAKALGKDISNGNASINVYAQWKPNNYALTLDANGGAPNNQTLILTYNVGDYCDIGTSTPTRLGYEFLGWYTSANDGIKIYDADGVCTNEGTYWKDNKYIYPNNITLYAQWKLSGVIYIDNGIDFEKYLIYIDDGTSWDLYLSYIDNGTNWAIIS